MRKAEITVHLFQEIRHIMLDRPAKNLHRYEFCVCCGGITPYQVDTPVGRHTGLDAEILH